jgi:hypothetical protein
VAGISLMDLHGIRDIYQELFHPNQDWFRDEEFAKRQVETTLTMPTGVYRGPRDGVHFHPFASALAALYVRYPDDPIWDNYLWCADTDRHGQRVFMGKNNGKMEIHRHLHLTDRWGSALWR